MASGSARPGTGRWLQGSSGRTGRWILAPLAALLCLPSPAPAGPWPNDPTGLVSFDCDRAVSRVERLVCDDKRLHLPDRQVATNYERLRKHSPPAARPAIIAAQRRWLARRDACPDFACVEQAYEARLNELIAADEALEDRLMRPVSRVGGCDTTELDDIGPRLLNSHPPNGLGLGYANGVDQESYERPKRILKSRVGDKVRVCLVKIQPCVPGNYQWRYFSSHNLRTGARWTLASTYPCRYRGDGDD